MRKQKAFVLLAVKEEVVDENDVRVIDITRDFMLASVKRDMLEREYDGDDTLFVVKEYVP